LGTHHHLAVAELAQCSRVLRRHPDRRGPLPGQSRVVEDQRRCCRRVDRKRPWVALDGGYPMFLPGMNSANGDPGIPSHTCRNDYYVPKNLALSCASESEPLL
jgi:hypothetical protein